MSTLMEVRRGRGLSQTVVGERMGVDQRQVSRIEGGNDLLLSSLVRYVEALGGELELRARFDGNESVPLDLVAYDSTASTRLKRRVLAGDTQ